MSEGNLGRKKKILIISIVITVVVCASVVVWWQTAWRSGNSLLKAPAISITCVNTTSDAGNYSVLTIHEIDYGDFLRFDGTFSLHNMTYSWGWGERNGIHGKLVDIVNNFSSPIIYIDGDHDNEMSIGDVIMLNRDWPQIEGPFGLLVFSPSGFGYHVNTEIIGYE